MTRALPTNGVVRGYDELLQENGALVSVEDVEEWLDNEMFLCIRSFIVISFGLRCFIGRTLLLSRSS
jgi:hypothetical protein